MLTIYPSNRLEDLATLLMAVMGHIQSQANEQNILKPQQIIVESRGIRHWLQMELAAKQGVAMNLQFPMPGTFIWSICRKVLGEQMPADALYSEEILRWRIDSVLADENFQSHPASKEVNQYWQTGKVDLLKRFQLASKLASLFQQYMTFRPTWISAWDAGQIIAGIAGIDPMVQQWQAHLWQLLIKQNLNSDLNYSSKQNLSDGPLQPTLVTAHPVRVQNDALSVLASHQDKLPRHILLFGINQMPVPSLAFFQALAAQPGTTVHLFHLNPCVDYWGDLLADKQLARQRRFERWSSWLTENQVSNPLLANLGQQGKEFCEALQDLPDSFEISAFDAVNAESSSAAKATVLQCLQRDILLLKDARSTPKTTVDDSIYISSAHSPLREIQALHDYLLHQVNWQQQNVQPAMGDAIVGAVNDITPGDILVMCPNIEDYAPYVDAVFRRPWQLLSADDTPRWPCSIADRSSLDEEPMVSAFMDLLRLPDSRFEVSQVLDYVRLPAIAHKFGFSSVELDTIEWWLREAGIHWGLDAEDKKNKAGLDQASDTCTWLWGLERLLLGFAFGDAEHIDGNRLVLPHVEGQNALLLGRLRYFIEQLKQVARELSVPRDGDDWQTALQDIKDALFAADGEDSEASLAIDRAISQLGESLRLSGYAHKIDYRVISSCLNNALSQPDTGNHFMVGQVTFCSMIPMRSVPFKIIAVLGLNDSDFPRQDRRASFDLLAHAHRKGDRSRRADDRYLFLETLISARAKLYLSYQGRAVKDNQPRQPSLVLKELMNYLEQGYGWQLAGAQPADLHQQPLHAFSPACYPQPHFEHSASADPAGEQHDEDSIANINAAAVHRQQILPSFNNNWCRLLSQGRVNNNSRLTLEPFLPPDEVLDLESLVRFFDDPLQTLARERLGLYLQNEEALPDDVEPFTVGKLIQYQIRSDLCEARLKQVDVETTLKRYTLSGKLPESPVTDAANEQLDAESLAVFRCIQALGLVKEEQNIELPVGAVRLGTRLLWLKKGQHLLNYRAGRCKPKDKVRLWLTHLVGSALTGSQITTTGVFLKEKSNDVMVVNLLPLPATCHASELLRSLLDEWQFGLSQPSLVHASLGCQLARLSDTNWAATVADQLQGNVYFQWFYGSAEEREINGEPDESHLLRLQALYTPMNLSWQGELCS